jgi:hypothetical protein
VAAPILQRRLPFTPWAEPALARLPGLAPVEGPWVVVDEAYGPQMAERARLLRTARDAVLIALPGTEEVQAEALDAVRAGLPPGFAPGPVAGRRPAAPLEEIAALVQEDVLLCLPRDGAHVLVAGLLCFPASWTLAEKMGRPLAAIHAPVPDYDAALAARVERLFRLARPGRPTWRANALAYHDPALHQPRPEGAPRPAPGPAPYLRCERQTILRLPRTGAILFAVHTYVLPACALSPAQRAGCPVPLDYGATGAKCLESFSA